MKFDDIIFLLPSKLAFVCMLLSVLVPVAIGRVYGILKKWADPHHENESNQT
ncbi:hypothetical protein [Priestia abyssalis]|uniref:hypothetical protein n=1 Tax=Priestia abyssalis TaxID=1221450 RepID=UPI001474C3AF|nr:hypothetical protein [Priestia abyssalis]